MSCKNCPYPEQDPNKTCKHNDCDWWISSKDYYNCFLVYEHFIKKPHTLHEIAKLLKISHTTVKQIESMAIEEIKDKLKSGDLALKSLENSIKMKN